VSERAIIILIAHLTRVPDMAGRRRPRGTGIYVKLSKRECERLDRLLDAFNYPSRYAFVKEATLKMMEELEQKLANMIIVREGEI